MLDLHPGTGSSNPFPSSEESCKPPVPQRRLLGEGGHAFLADATDPEAAVFGEHVDRQLVRPVFVLAERVGDVALHPWLGSPNREREPRLQAIRASPLQANSDPSRRRYRVARPRIKGCPFSCRVGHKIVFSARSITGSF